MTPITDTWLGERGFLHDAQVCAVQIDGAKIRIRIDDEWANEHDGGDDRAGGVIVLHDAAILDGDIANIQGGWISEVEYRAGRLVFEFCDRGRLIIKGSAVWERAAAQMP